MTTDSSTKALIENAKAQIEEDIMGGLIPATCRSFAALHEYVDANDYIIDASDLDEANAMADALDEWLKAGRPHEHRGAYEDDETCAICNMIFCPDTRKEVDIEGRYHLDGSTCFLHQTAQP